MFTQATLHVYSSNAFIPEFIEDTTPPELVAETVRGLATGDEPTTAENSDDRPTIGRRSGLKAPHGSHFQTNGIPKPPKKKHALSHTRAYTHVEKHGYTHIQVSIRM